MAKSYDVAGIGNAIVDIIAPVTDDFLARYDITKGVMTLTDEPSSQCLIDALEGTREISGGSAANTMAGLASLGGTGLFIGRVKNDRLGRTFASDMHKSGISFETLPSNDGPSTACSVIMVTPDGQRSMSTYLGACRELTEADIDEDAIAKSRVLYIEGYLWDADVAKTAIRKAIAIAKKSSTEVAMTLSDPFCVGRFRDEFLELMREDLDILFANEYEAMALYKSPSFEDALNQARQWPGLLAITRSEKGAVIADKAGLAHSQPAEAVSRVVDTTGAGDQFAAGFLYGHTQGFSPSISARLGAIAAAEIISHYGARPEISLRALAVKAGVL